MSGKYWVTEPNAYLEPRIGKAGYSAMPAKTIIQAFQDTVRKHGNQKAMAAKVTVGVGEASCFCFICNSCFFF
jgi:hypothetical protein